MATLLIPAINLGVGDTLCLPFEKRATIDRIKPVGPKTQWLRYRTVEYGWSRVSVHAEVYVLAQPI